MQRKPPQLEALEGDGGNYPKYSPEIEEELERIAEKVRKGLDEFVAEAVRDEFEKRNSS